MDSWHATFLGLRRLPREVTAFEVEVFFQFSAEEARIIEERRLQWRTALTRNQPESRMTRPNEFSTSTQQLALARQKFRCGSCGTGIARLGKAGRAEHKYGEGAQAHHVRHVKFGGSDARDNCVILCQSCHYSVHEGGNYRFGTVIGTASDYPHFCG